MKKKTTSGRMKGYFISLYLLISVFLVIEGAISPLYATNNRGTESNQRVTTAQTVKEVFSYIEQNSNFVILYSKGILSDLGKKVSINMSGKKVEDILKELSSATGMEYKISDRQISVTKNAPAPQPQQSNADIKVTGQVFDELGETIPGANVTLKGNTGVGTVTDMDGNFTLNVPKGSVIVVSFIGYVSHEYAVKGGEKVIVKLTPDSKALDEVVVVGYGLQRKSSITGSIASVKADELKTVTTPSVANMLQGKVAGVVVTPTSGQPGAGVSISVRGTGSIRGKTEPLWVIDGVVGESMSSLNPNDIESISILKDGSATALYGSRGANGVVQVTTKRATSGGSSFDASVKFGISQLQKGNIEMMNGAEYYDYLVTAFTNVGYPNNVYKEWTFAYAVKQSNTANYEYKQLGVEKQADGTFIITSDASNFQSATIQEEPYNLGTRYYVVAKDGTKYVGRIEPEVFDASTKRGKSSLFLVYAINKCSYQEQSKHLWSPIISRLAEMYLIRAEANYERGGTVKATLDDINVLRERAGIPEWTEANIASADNGNKKDIHKIIEEERMLELAWEGHRRFDVFRWRQTMDRRYPGGHTISQGDKFYEIPYNSPSVCEFIPQLQYDAYPYKLEQNP